MCQEVCLPCVTFPATLIPSLKHGSLQVWPRVSRVMTQRGDRQSRSDWFVAYFQIIKCWTISVAQSIQREG